jgi:peptidoglycan hydrolase-like protein with peptidoglycan-binding domain
MVSLSLRAGPLQWIAWFCGVAPCVLITPAFSQAVAKDQVRLQQEMLIWTTEYEGLIDGIAGPETTKAINKFQARIGNPVTGRLTQEEEDKLVKQGALKRDRTGFRQTIDFDAGVSVGIPLRLVSNPTTTKWGKHWYGKEAGIAIDTLRFDGDVSLDLLFERLRSINNRTVTYERKVGNDWFVIAAYEKDAAVYVRANVVALPKQQSEIRGFSIWMSKDRPTDYQAIPPAMLSTFKSDIGTAASASSNAPKTSTSPANPPSQPTLRPNPLPTQPIPTIGPAGSIGECYRGLGDCPAMLTFR